YPSSSQEFFGVLAQARVDFPNLITEGHRRRIASGKIGDAVGLALVLAQPLRPSIRKVDDAIAAGPPAVVNSFVLRQTPASVIAIVGYLVIKLIRRRVQLEHPIQSP